MKDKVLLHDSIDLTANQPWRERGYTVEKLFSEKDFVHFKKETHSLLTSLWKKSGLKIPEGFSLDQYHTLAYEQSVHIAAIDQTKLISVLQFPSGIKKLEARISEILGIQLHVRNPFDQQSIFHFRVIRPQSNDNNPMHRDVWLEDYADCINLYIPVAGSNEKSSLTLVSGSHHWPESRVARTSSGALVKGMKFNVPAVLSIEGEYEIIRPNPKENEVLIFSPYLIHGGAANLNEHQTRISLEVRLWKQ